MDQIYFSYICGDLPTDFLTPTTGFREKIFKVFFNIGTQGK